MLTLFPLKHFEFVLFPKFGPHPGMEKPQVSLMFPLCSGSLESPANTLLRLQLTTCGSSTHLLHLKAAHQKASFKETPQAAAFEEAETKAFATSACRASPGQRISGRFPWGTGFSSLLHQFLLRTALLAAEGDEELLELLLPARGGSAPLFVAPHQGSYSRVLRTQIQQRKCSLGSPVVSKSSCG